MSLVGYSKKKQQSQLTAWDHTLAGGLSGGIGRLILQPLDVAKIRMQLQVEARQARKYSGLFNLILQMGREEGVRSLWKGHVSAQLLSISYGISSFGAFEVFTKLSYQRRLQRANSGKGKEGDSKYKPLEHFVCGSLGGCVGTLTSLPFDVIRTRMVAQPEGNKMYLSVRDAAAKLHAEGGFRAFYKGLVPTLAAIGPQTGLQFGFYTLFTQILESLVTAHDDLLKHEVMTSFGSLFCGALAGLSSKLSVYPLDTIKKRLQISGWQGRQGLGTTPSYSGTLHCARDVVAREGLHGLYKGMGPALTKAAVASSLNFWLYEHICYLLALRFSLDTS
eukprot:TRINITY_DN2465_c0_g1_i6.p1 TRINITY_DN2465_c0_g1~~TRINITY_DN2465_c0_g1_i6.p1  ORF type:complete len:334 (-),score=62.71 TRINITY_DN2465_c0_g1_i6:297-1298(-)